MAHAKAYAAADSTSALAPYEFDRREVGEQDVQIDILFCGVCHSDLHNVNNGWGSSRYPLVPGHEIVGEVTAIGSTVRKFAVGDCVAIGTIVDSCGECALCRMSLEQYCCEYPA